MLSCHRCEALLGYIYMGEIMLTAQSIPIPILLDLSFLLAALEDVDCVGGIGSGEHRAELVG